MNRWRTAGIAAAVSVPGVVPAVSIWPSEAATAPVGGGDEIAFGAMAINDNGTALWNTGQGHGDAMDVGDLDPAHAGQEVFKVLGDGMGTPPAPKIYTP